MMATDLDGIAFTLGQVDGKLDLLVKQAGIQDDRIEKVSNRVSKVEAKQHWYAGAAAVVASIAAWIFKPHGA